MPSELRAKIKRHYNGIVAAIKNGLTDARMEAMNNKIKVIKRRAYGFRNMDNLIARSEAVLLRSKTGGSRQKE